MLDTEGLWCVLLIPKRKIGEHWLLKKMAELDWNRTDEPAVKTRHYRLAVQFATEPAAQQFIKVCGYLPRGYIAQAAQILPPRVRRKPQKRTLQTPYGPVTLLEDQMCLFSEAT